MKEGGKERSNDGDVRGRKGRGGGEEEDRRGGRTDGGKNK